MVGLFDIEVMKKDQVVLLLHAGKIRVFSEVPSRVRAGCACCCSPLRTCRSRMAGACVGSVRVREQPVHMWNAWTFCLCAHAVLAVLCFGRACLLRGGCWAVCCRWTCATRARESDALEWGAAWRSAERCANWVPNVPQKSF